MYFSFFFFRKRRQVLQRPHQPSVPSPLNWPPHIESKLPITEPFKQTVIIPTMIFGHSLITNTSSNFYHFSLYPFFFLWHEKTFLFLRVLYISSYYIISAVILQFIFSTIVLSLQMPNNIHGVTYHFYY